MIYLGCTQGTVQHSRALYKRHYHASASLEYCATQPSEVVIISIPPRHPCWEVEECPIE